jgi:hypothetical protein|tara:strand:+ start:483 stop:722 length:240 start_codon:yes stop_codon:yes gene_type:complete
MIMTKKKAREYYARRSDLIRLTKKFEWVDLSKQQPLAEGLYFTKCNEFRGEVELTQYDGVGNWSTSFKPDYWSEPIIEK